MLKTVYDPKIPVDIGELELLWDPPWDMEMMSPAAKLRLEI
jgi:metal-sulfur cluster biosynthetic enzyme